jgi:hypothetical protein
MNKDKELYDEISKTISYLKPTGPLIWIRPATREDMVAHGMPEYDPDDFCVHTIISEKEFKQ